MYHCVFLICLLKYISLMYFQCSGLVSGREIDGLQVSKHLAHGFSAFAKKTSTAGIPTEPSRMTSVDAECIMPCLQPR